MTISSAPLSSSAFFSPALFSLQRSGNEYATSVARLSSGSRVINASDDVASFSIASRLQSQLSGLKQASQNAVQGSSMLQVASGGLTQIRELLDRLNSLAAQSNSGSITSNDRVYLQAQFDEYMEQIDSIAEGTRFNNIVLLDGTLSGENKAQTTTTASTKAGGTITFSAISNGNTVRINGVTLTAGTDFAVGGNLSATVTNLVEALNTSTNTALSSVTYTKSGSDSIVIAAKSGGKLGNQFIIDKANSTATFTVPVGASTNAANVYTLTGGLDGGLSINSTRVTGTIGDSLINTQSQIAAYVTLAINGTVSNGELLRIDNGNGGYVNFTFATTASTSTDIQIGATVEETLQNAVETLTQYSASSDYGVRQLQYQINGNNLVISNKTIGNPTSLSGTNLAIATTLANGSLSAASFSNGVNTGVNVSGLNNAEFLGTIAGITATYVSADKVNLSVTVGSSTYTATVTDTTPGSLTMVRFTSSGGGYFDAQLSAAGLAVTNQTDANSFATRLNAAFSGLTFHNERPVSNFTATGSFIGASAKLMGGDFDDIRIDSISVTAPLAEGLDGTIDISINGTIYRASSGIGGRIGAYETIRFTSLDDANDVLSLTNGATDQSFTNTTNAATLRTALRTAFGLDSTGSGVDFQIGENAEDTMNVVVNTATVDKLFSGSTPSISSQSNAAAAQTAIDTAIISIQTTIAKVGALQQRFDDTATGIAARIQGITAAKSNLVDTDVAEESTALALASLKINSAIAVIAQATNLQSGLLGALKFGGN